MNCASCTKSRTLESGGNAPYYKPMNVASKHGSQSFGSQDSDNLRNPITWQPDVSQYQLHNVIGRGTFGSITVHLAQHIPSGKSVAIKRIDIEGSPVEFKVFQDEVILCRQMHHDNIVKYHCTFVNDKELWIVLPLLGYGSARDVLHAYFKTGLPEAAIAYILRDVVSALDYLHNRGIIHRSIRASHILIGGNGNVCLSGLRSAYHLIYHGKKWSRVYDYPNACNGDLQWLSPEILEQNLSGYDTKSDIYSFGITSWELANGYPPFEDMPVTQVDMPVTQMLLEKVNGTKPMLPDCTTIGELTGEEEAQHNENMENGGIDIVAIAKARKFSSHFHNLLDRCLEKNPHCRPTAESLLTDSMFKQLKRRSTEALPNLLQPLTPIKLANLTSDREDEALDSMVEDMEQVNLVGEWEF